MATLDLLNRELKSAEMVELLEMNRAQVIYDFDRAFEGRPDRYRVSLPDQAMQLIFDAHQRVQTIFIDLNTESDQSYETDDGFPLFSSPKEAAAYAKKQKVAFREGAATAFGKHRVWIRLEYPAHAIHYEYHSGKLAKVTLMRSDVVPGKR